MGNINFQTVCSTHVQRPGELASDQALTSACSRHTTESFGSCNRVGRISLCGPSNQTPLPPLLSFLGRGPFVGPGSIKVCCVIAHTESHTRNNPTIMIIFSGLVQGRRVTRRLTRPSRPLQCRVDGLAYAEHMPACPFPPGGWSVVQLRNE